MEIVSGDNNQLLKEVLKQLKDATTELRLLKNQPQSDLFSSSGFFPPLPDFFQSDKSSHYGGNNRFPEPQQQQSRKGSLSTGYGKFPEPQQGS